MLKQQVRSDLKHLKNRLLATSRHPLFKMASRGEARYGMAYYLTLISRQHLNKGRKIPRRKIPRRGSAFQLFGQLKSLEMKLHAKSILSLQLLFSSLSVLLQRRLKGFSLTITLFCQMSHTFHSVSHKSIQSTCSIGDLANCFNEN